METAHWASPTLTCFRSPMSNSSFEFALDDPRWSDRKLRIIVSSDSEIFVNRASLSEDQRQGLHVIQIINVNSVILAKESGFFRRLFGGDGFRDSNTNCTDIHISHEEKRNFQHLITCIYTGEISLTQVEELIALWILSERFLVQSCSQLCIKRLREMPLDLGQAVRILEAAYMSNPCGELGLLIEASTHFLVLHFKTLSFVNSKHSRESDRELLKDFICLPQTALKALLGSDQLQVEREEIAFYALILWVKENTCTAHESQLMTAELAPHIRFPYMKADVLSGLIEYPELAGPLCKELVVEGLKFRSATDDMKQKFRMEGINHRRFEKRKGYMKPINALVLEQPKKLAIIHFSASLEEFEALEPSGQLTYDTFRVAGSSFAFQIHQVLTVSNRKKVGIDLRMCTSTVARVQVDLNVSVWSVPLMVFLHRFYSKHTFQADSVLLRCSDLFGKDLKELLAEKSHWVCDGKIFLYAELVIRS